MLRSKTITFCKVLILLLVIHSCTPTSKITYLNDSQLKEWDVSPIPPKHRLEIGDILMVKVISGNAESNDLFNIEPPPRESTIFLVLITFPVNAENKVLSIGSLDAKITVKVFSSLLMVVSSFLSLILCFT